MGVGRIGRLVLGTIKYLASPESRMAYRAHRTDGRTGRKVALQTLGLPKEQRDEIIFPASVGRFKISPRPGLSDASTGSTKMHLIDSYQPYQDTLDAQRDFRWRLGVKLEGGFNIPSSQVSFGIGQDSIFDSKVGGGNGNYFLGRPTECPQGAEMVTGPNTTREPGGGRFRITRREVGNRVGAEPDGRFKITRREVGNRVGAQTQRREWINVATWYFRLPISAARKIAAGVRNILRGWS